MLEQWRSVVGYEGLYEVSDKGRVKSLISGRVLKLNIGTSGYFMLNLYMNKTPRARLVHQLVAEAFLNHTPCGQKTTVDHIDGNKLNNKLSNLQLLSIRANTNRSVKVGASGYRGVVWNSINKKWQVRPRLGGLKINFGYYDCPLKAHIDYSNFTKYLEDIETHGKNREELRGLIEIYKQKIKELK